MAQLSAICQSECRSVALGLFWQCFGFRIVGCWCSSRHVVWWRFRVPSLMQYMFQLIVIQHLYSLLQMSMRYKVSRKSNKSNSLNDQ